MVTSEENAGYDPNCDWAFGNQFLAHPRQGQAADMWAVTEEMNSTANASPAMGWLANSENVATQVANISAVAEEYKLSWALMGSPEDYQARMDAYRTALYNAGLQDVIDEYQAQVNEFLAANGK